MPVATFEGVRIGVAVRPDENPIRQDWSHELTNVAQEALMRRLYRLIAKLAENRLVA